MLKPIDAAARAPSDFAPILATKAPVLIVGGQAVNLWALAFFEDTKELSPFTSRDAGILGDAEVLKELGKLAGTRPQYFPRRPLTNEVGVVVAKDVAGVPMLVEVLRTVNGVTNEEMLNPAYTVALGSTDVIVKVPGPIALLQAKLANVREINQTGRQDGRHVLILATLMPSYLRMLETSVKEGSLTEKGLLGFLERLLEVVASKRNRKVMDDLALNPRDLFSNPNSAKLPKLRAFRERRLPRIFPTT